MTGIDPQREAELARKRLLGWGLEAEPVEAGVRLGRDLVLQNGPNGLDFAKVEGMDALTQALTLALTTLRGDDIFNVSFGFEGLNAMVEGTDPILTRESIRVAWRAFFEDWDILVCPQMATPAFEHDHSERFTRSLKVGTEDQPYFQQLFWSGLVIGAYLPSTVFPTGPSAEGLPIGVQAVGREGGEA